MSDSSSINGVSALKTQDYSVLSIVCIVYCSVAAGAFGVEEIIQGCGPGMTIIVLIGIALLWALPDCLRTAELASVMPGGEGGYYYWAKQIFGEFWAFQMGWWFAIGFYVCSSTYVVLAVNYLSTIVPISNAQAIIIKLAIILIFTVVNLMGLKEVSLLSIIFSVIILLAFAAVTVVGFSNWNYNPVAPFVPAGMGVMEALGMGIGIGIWMYCGWGAITMVAGEISNPQVIPKALLIIVPLAAVSYILPTIAGLASVGNWDKWSTIGSEGVGFSTVLSNYIGPAATTIFVIIAIIGQLAMFNTNIAGGSRAFFVLADDNLFPKKLITKVSKKRGVPYVGILTMSIVTILMMQMTFKALILIQVIPILAGACFMSVLIIKARKTIPVESRANCYVVSGGKIGLYTVAIFPAVIALAAFYLNGLDYFLYGLIVLFSGVVLYLIFKPLYGGYSNNEPNRYPLNAKTRLAFGDIYQISKMMSVIGLLAISGSFVLKWLEGDGGPEYYADEYGSGLLSSFEGMLNFLLVGGVACLAIAFICGLLGEKLDKKIETPAETQ